MLTATRKADREKMAAQFAKAMQEAGATVERLPARDYAPRRVRFLVTAPGGAYIGVDIDGDLPDILGGTWNTPARVFLNPMLGSVNPYHFGKLNVYESTLEGLIFRLARHVELFRSGEGYLTENAPQIVAMRNRYRAQGWNWYGEAA